MSIVDDLKALQPTIYQHVLDEFRNAMDAGFTSEADMKRQTGFMDRVASRRLTILRICLPRSCGLQKRRCSRFRPRVVHGRT